MTVSFEMIKRLMFAYPHSTINESGEFCTLFNNYFNLESCADNSEVECKVLEWFSRPACKDGTSRCLRNSINRERTKRYIASGFDISVLSEDD